MHAGTPRCPILPYISYHGSIVSYIIIESSGLRRSALRLRCLVHGNVNFKLSRPEWKLRYTNPNQRAAAPPSGCAHHVATTCSHMSPSMTFARSSSLSVSNSRRRTTTN